MTTKLEALTTTFVVGGLLITGLGGCDDQGGVQSYSVPAETPPPVSPVADAAPISDRLTGDMHWDVPAGWTEAPNPNTMRFATLLTGEGEDASEVAITRLGGQAGGLAPNVNLWREQVGLAPAKESELESLLVPINARGGVRGIFTDLIGPSGDRILAAIFPAHTNTWFIKCIGPESGLQAQREKFLELCASVHFSGEESAPAPVPVAAANPPATSRPAASQPAVAGASDITSGGGLSWDPLPAGWQVDATPKAMSVVSMTVRGDAQEASLTITPLGGNQDLLANVNRWRRQRGLGPLASAADMKAMDIEIDGTPGQLVDIAGSDGRTLAAMTTRGGATWFYKLSGPDPLVATQKHAFEQFVRSIRFDGGARG